MLFIISGTMFDETYFLIELLCGYIFLVHNQDQFVYVAVMGIHKLGQQAHRMKC